MINLIFNENTKKDINKLKNSIKENICSAKYEKNDMGCIVRFPEECITPFYHITNILPKLDNDFIVYRGMWETDCFNIGDYINGFKKELNFYGTISTTFDFNFVKKWITYDIYTNCIFKISVSANNNYIIVYDDYSETNQSEITLAPGKLIINDCKKTSDNKILFIANYEQFNIDYIQNLYKQKYVLIGGNSPYYYKYLKYKKKYLLAKQLL